MTAIFFIDELGNLWGYGCNTYGTLGLGNVINKKKEFSEIEIVDKERDCKIVKVESTLYNTMVLDEKGDIWITGSHNYFGRLYNIEGRCYFTKIDIIKNNMPIRMSSIYCGKRTAFCIDEKGKIWGCGRNNCGQLGIGDCEWRENFQEISNNFNTRIVSMSLTINNTLALDDEGNVWATGANEHGSLGLGNHKKSVVFQKALIPKPITLISNFENYSKVVDTDGNIWISGQNNFCKNSFFKEYKSSLPSFIKIYQNISLDSNGNMWVYDNNLLKNEILFPKDPNKIESFYKRINFIPEIHVIDFYCDKKYLMVQDKDNNFYLYLKKSNIEEYINFENIKIIGDKIGKLMGSDIKHKKFIKASL